MVELNHDFCDAIRADIKRYGLEFVLKTQILRSSSEKNPLRKAYLAREGKKKASFKQKIRSTLDKIATECPELRLPALRLRAEIAA